MPIRTWIDVEGGLVRGEVWGSFDIDEILESIDSLVLDPTFEAGMDVLTDHSRVEKFISTPQAKHMAAHFSTLRDQFAHARWAVITGGPASHGAIRMMAAHLERIPIYVWPFQNMAEAQAWLSEPRFRPGQDEAP